MTWLTYSSKSCSGFFDQTHNICSSLFRYDIRYPRAKIEANRIEEVFESDIGNARTS